MFWQFDQGLENILTGFAQIPWPGSFGLKFPGNVAQFATDHFNQCLQYAQLVVEVVDSAGNELKYTVDEGDHFWAPAGFKYTLKASGVEAINFWTMAPVLHTGWRDTGDPAGPGYSDMLLDARKSA